jgi:hypothetical protein
MLARPSKLGHWWPPFARFTGRSLRRSFATPHTRSHARHRPFIARRERVGFAGRFRPALVMLAEDVSNRPSFHTA